jgi:asparagine synthase (glutamine-hydrolysing)
MCGLAGQLAFDSAGVLDGELDAMAAALAHRGPDDEGFHRSGPVGFAFRRLSIIDLAEGHQPMSDAQGEVWVMLNGEIYNFTELRADLVALGHRFRTRSDTEVIVHGYRQWGDGVLERLNGMFGIAVWDERRRRLLLARDRAGIKLIYYRLEHNRLIFGSELRAIRAVTGRPVLDPVALNLFLRYRYTPSPLTLYQGVRKLAPGTKLIVEDDAARVERWWDLDPTPIDRGDNPSKCRDELLDRYTEAVRRQLVSDVPLGLLLSGGIDSALLLALMSRHGGPWPTFTVGFGPGYANDELSDAAATAAIFGADHTEVRLDRAGFEADLPAVIDALEEPIASPSVVALYHVCRRARENVKVALIGQGPDELFGGYTRHLGVRYGHHWRRVPAPVRHATGAALARLPRAESLHRGLHSLDAEPRLVRYQQVFSLLPGAEVDRLFQPDTLPDLAGDAILDCWGDVHRPVSAGDELGAFQYLELRSSLPDELLMCADKLSMAHGLELRVPYLDHELTEWIGGLPAMLKVRWGRRKWLHRQVCRQFLPREILRRKKRGFGVDVVDRWFRESLDGRVRESLLAPDALLYGLLRPEPVEALVREHQAGRRDRHKIVFSLVVLEQWLRQTGVGVP